MRNRLKELIKHSPETVEDATEHFIHVGVIFPPCKIGDIVYHPSYYRSGVMEGEIRRIIIDDSGIVCETNYRKINADEFGKTVFFTREEAEKALEKGEKHE